MVKNRQKQFRMLDQGDYEHMTELLKLLILSSVIGVSDEDADLIARVHMVGMKAGLVKGLEGRLTEPTMRDATFEFGQDAFDEARRLMMMLGRKLSSRSQVEVQVVDELKIGDRVYVSMDKLRAVARVLGTPGVDGMDDDALVQYVNRRSEEETVVGITGDGKLVEPLTGGRSDESASSERVDGNGKGVRKGSRKQ